MITALNNKPLSLFLPVALGDISHIRLMNRMDTKFVFHAGSLPALLQKLIPYYHVLDMDGERSFLYQTRYFDTSDMLFYRQHVTGKLPRFKVRFRTYESTGISYLEVKMKSNSNRTVKWRIRNQSSPYELNNEAKLFIKEHVPLPVFQLQETLDNIFTRITLAGSGTRERVTIDTGMTYSNNHGGSVTIPCLAVAELKSEGYPSSSSPFIRAMKEMRIHSTGFSKYCMGNALIGEVPKKNMLKQKIMLLNKIENEYSEFNVA
jgi:hypothetical protein